MDVGGSGGLVGEPWAGPINKVCGGVGGGHVAPRSAAPTPP